MINIFEDTNPKKLKELLSDIHNQGSVLPDFQRDFVWEPSATQELIVSIANNYPAGSILRVRDTQRLFATRVIEGVKSSDSAIHTFLVLDGQQRLTSLYQAFYGVGEHRYFLKLQKLIDGQDFEEAIFHVRTSTKWAQAREDFALQASELLLPLSVLKNGSGGFYQWMMALTNPMSSDDRVHMQNHLNVILEKWIQPIDEYHFPVVTLSEKTEPAALCTIFETLNRTGVKLTVFELLTARFWPKNIKLRELWESAQIKHSIIKEFDVDPYYVLQAIALASRTAPSCKRSEVLKLEAIDIDTWWDKVISGLALGLKILRDDCKVMLPKWVPYQTMIPPLAAILAKTDVQNSPSAGALRDQVKRWFWCSVLGQTYDNAANTQAAKDLTEVIGWFNSGPVPESVNNLSFDPNSLRRTTPRQRAVYSGIICLILSADSGARDFHNLSVITANMINDEGIDDHHIFPANYLAQRNVGTYQLRDCVLNRTLIDMTTNRMIQDRAPSEYMANIRDTPNFPLDEVLSSHLLPTGEDSPFWTNDFEAFLDYRQKKIWAEICRVTGLTDPENLEEDVPLVETP